MEDPTNLDRARWARIGVAGYFHVTRLADDYDPISYGPENPEGEDFILEVVGDLVCDLFHLAAESGVTPNMVIARAEGHYFAEADDF